MSSVMGLYKNLGDAQMVAQKGISLGCNLYALVQSEGEREGGVIV
jgi:hypothetical protein